MVLQANGSGYDNSYVHHAESLLGATLLQILIRPLQTPPVSIRNMLGLAQPVWFTRIHDKFRRHGYRFKPR
jgi:hypothetical protein